jgi:hypothetical protein
LKGVYRRLMFVLTLEVSLLKERSPLGVMVDVLPVVAVGDPCGVWLGLGLETLPLRHLEKRLASLIPRT